MMEPTAAELDEVKRLLTCDPGGNATRRVALFVKSIRREARAKTLQDVATHIVDEFEEPFSIREALEAIKELQARS